MTRQAFKGRKEERKRRRKERREGRKEGRRKTKPHLPHVLLDAPPWSSTMCPTQLHVHSCGKTAADKQSKEPPPVAFTQSAFLKWLLQQLQAAAQGWEAAQNLPKYFSLMIDTWSGKLGFQNWTHSCFMRGVAPHVTTDLSRSQNSGSYINLLSLFI